MTTPTRETSYMYHAQGLAFPLSQAVPAAMEAGCWALYFKNHSSALKNKALETKQLMVESCSRKEEESGAEFAQRVVQNVSIVLVCAALLTLTVVCPFLSLPLYLAIPMAIIGFCGVADLLVNGKSYIAKAKKKWQETKEWYLNPEVSLAKKAVVTGVALITLGLTCYGISYVVLYALHMLSSGSVAMWNAYAILPGSTSALGTFAWYGALGVAHGALACYHWSQGNKTEAFVHLLCAVCSIAFPFLYMWNPSHTSTLRLHHSFLALAIMLVPSTALKSLGGMILLDAGINTFYFQTGPAGEFDFMSIVEKHLTTFITTFSVLLGLECIRTRLLPYNKEEGSSPPLAKEAEAIELDTRTKMEWEQEQQALKEEAVAKELSAEQQQLTLDTISA